MKAISIIAGKKICSACKFEKPISEFCKDEHASSGYKSTCRICTGIMVQKYKEQYQKLLNDRQTDGHIMIKFKVCSICKIEKPIVEFHKREYHKDGYRSECIDCQTIKQKEYYIKNREKIIKKTAEYQKRHPEQAKLRGRKSQLKNLYGLTLEDYQKIFDFQEGKCAICERHQSEFTRVLVVDHNHKTGKVRGLLCDGCNLFLGVVENDLEKLRKTMKYLEER